MILYGDDIQLPECGFFTMSEPACGAGGMVLAFVKEMIKQKHNPAHYLELWESKLKRGQKSVAEEKKIATNKLESELPSTKIIDIGGIVQLDLFENL